MISAAVLYKFRTVSYDWDWLDALEGAFDARMLDVRREPPADPIYDADVVIIHHSVLATPNSRIPHWARVALNMRRGRLVMFLTNEFRDFDRRKELANDLGVDWMCTQLPLTAALPKYGCLSLGLASYRLIEMPAALNARAFKPEVWWSERKFDIGYRGTHYPGDLGDDDRNSILKEARMLGPGADVRVGMEHMVYRPDWARLLNSWRTTVSTESGMRGAKCLASRHMDAIGTGTLQIMPAGDFNGILKAGRHYIPLDGIPLADALAEALDRRQIAKEAREYAADCHTYQHRVGKLLDALGAGPSTFTDVRDVVAA